MIARKDGREEHLVDLVDQREKLFRRYQLLNEAHAARDLEKLKDALDWAEEHAPFSAPKTSSG